MFVVGKSTLCKHSDSLLALLFSGRHDVAKDPLSGAYFIDRDPEPFSAMLSWLRNGDLPRANRIAFAKELKFWQLSPVAIDVDQQEDLVFEQTRDGYYKDSSGQPLLYWGVQCPKCMLVNRSDARPPPGTRCAYC